MAINLKKALTAFGYGLVDIGMQELDASQGLTAPFRKATDISRVVVCLGSLAYGFFRPSELADDLFVASAPLLTQSIYYAAKATVGTPTVVTPTVTPAPTAVKVAPTAPAGKYVVTG